MLIRDSWICVCGESDSLFHMASTEEFAKVIRGKFEVYNFNSASDGALAKIVRLFHYLFLGRKTTDNTD